MKDGFLQTPIEVLLVRQLSPDTWETLVRPGRKVPTGERIIFGEGELEGQVEGRGEYGVRIIRFTSRGGFHEALDRLGHIPLPPYIKREDEPADRERYQTVFAKRGAAVAAPTAGLHFTPAILDELTTRGIEIVEITLEVGLGTFEPVRTERLEDHKIHAEPYEISPSTAAAIAGAAAGKAPCARYRNHCGPRSGRCCGERRGRSERLARRRRTFSSIRESLSASSISC